MFPEDDPIIENQEFIDYLIKTYFTPEEEKSTDKEVPPHHI